MAPLRSLRPPARLTPAAAPPAPCGGELLAGWRWTRWGLRLLPDLPSSPGCLPLAFLDPLIIPHTPCRHDGRLASAPQSIPQTPHTTPHRTPAPSAAGSPTRRAAAAGPATPGLAMPPLRSIASPAPAHGAAAAEPAGGFERLAAAISAPATLKAVQVGGRGCLVCGRGGPRSPRCLSSVLLCYCPHLLTLARSLPAAQALLGRLEARLSVKGLGAGCVAGPMRRLFPRAPAGRALERYPPRVFLCAYMILAHPGERLPGWLAGCSGGGAGACTLVGARPQSLPSRPQPLPPPTPPPPARQRWCSTCAASARRRWPPRPAPCWPPLSRCWRGWQRRRRRARAPPPPALTPGPRRRLKQRTRGRPCPPRSPPCCRWVGGGGWGRGPVCTLRPCTRLPQWLSQATSRSISLLPAAL